MTALLPPAPPRDDDRTAAPPPPAPPNGHQRSALVLGALLIAGGLAWLAATLGLLDVGWTTITAGLLVVLGLATVGLGLTGHRAGLLTGLAGVLTLILAVAATLDLPTVTGGIGDRVERPTTVTDLAPTYELGMGELTLDLADIDLPTGTTSVTAAVGAGELRVRVPSDITVVVTADVAIGDAEVFGETRSGVGVQHELTTEVPGSETTLELDLSVATGSIEVTR